MIIIGNGVDIVENRRIFTAIKKKEFIKRIFSKQEINDSKNYKNKANYYAKRFAAKEAFLKALGTGLREGIEFKDISVKKSKIGKPSLLLSGKLKKFIYRKFKIKKFETHVSLSDEKKHSIAFVILNTK
tara:strand:+ start:249 stop:635 length:387 start_codon:yes stop_codon:yes gene_type:complete